MGFIKYFSSKHKLLTHKNNHNNNNNKNNTKHNKNNIDRTDTEHITSDNNNNDNTNNNTNNGPPLTHNDILHILTYLPHEEICKTARISKAFKKCVDDKSIWKNLHINNKMLGNNNNSNKRSGSKSSSSVMMRSLLETWHKKGRLNNVYNVEISASLLGGREEQFLYARLPNLRTLRIIGSSNIQEQSMRVLVHCCPQLADVYLEDVNISDSALTELSKAPALKSISLLQLSGPTKHSLTPLLKRQLVKDLSFKKFAAEDLCCVAPLCGSFFFLNLNSSHLADSDLTTVTKHCTNLQKISISGCSRITDEGVNGMITNCPSTKYLNMSNCSGVTATSFEAALSLRNLTHLNFSYNGNISPLNIIPNDTITSLDLSFTNVSDEDIINIKRSFPALTNLLTIGCLQLSDTAAEVEYYY